MGKETTIKIEGENAFLTVGGCDYNVCPEGDVNLLIPVGVQGEPGLVTLAQFTALANAYNAALPEFLTNADAFVGIDPDGNPTTALGAGKEFIYAQGSTEAPQGIKAITYTP